MITGGGANNCYLIDRIKYYFDGDIVIPSENIVFVRLGHMRGEKLSDGSLTDMPIYVKEVLQWTK